MLKEQRGEISRRQQIIARVNTFISSAQDLGLEKSRWSTFDVHIQEAVTFFELKQILNQCANTSAYYFKPVSLHINTIPELEDKTKQNRTPSTQQDSEETGDVMLALKGAFLVRNP